IGLLTPRNQPDESPAPAPAVGSPPATTPIALPQATGPEAVPEPGEISTRTLLDQMIDLEQLARLPAAPFSAGQTASTDRRSHRPQDGDSWFANDDFVTDTQPNLVRVEPGPGGGKRYVLLDEAGPGAILRLWSATPAGTLRIYVDGDPKPPLEASFPPL